MFYSPRTYFTQPGARIVFVGSSQAEVQREKHCRKNQSSKKNKYLTVLSRLPTSKAARKKKDISAL
jgi:hypothetical protein